MRRDARTTLLLLVVGLAVMPAGMAAMPGPDVATAQGPAPAAASGPAPAAALEPEATAPYGPLLQALAFVPEGEPLTLDFTDWAALAEQPGGPDLAWLGLGHLADWPTAWGWDTTDLAWQLNLAPTPLAASHRAPADRLSTTILRFTDRWDAAPFMAQLERQGFVREDGPGFATYTPTEALDDPGAELLRLFGPRTTDEATDSATAAPPELGVAVTFVGDGRTVILEQGDTGRELAELSMSNDAEGVAERPFGRVAAGLGRPLVARIISGDVGCSGTGAENGVLRGRAARLAASVGRLRPYQASGVGYGRADQPPPAVTTDPAADPEGPVGRYVFEYERAGQAERDLAGRRRLLGWGEGPELAEAAVIGSALVLDVGPLAKPPAALLDRLTAPSALLPICGPPPGIEPPTRRPTDDVPLFAGPATLALAGQDGLYAWDEVHFGADEVRVRATVSSGREPCSANIAAVSVGPRADGREADDRPAATGDPMASEGFAAGPGETATHRATVGVDYATTSLRVDSTCSRWSLRLEPLDDANLPYSLEERFYPVHGEAFSELVPQMSHVKDKWAAFAKWQTDSQFELLDSGSSCDVTSGSADLDGTITYPRWRPPANADPMGVARWGRLMESLATHELGHITIALQGADAVDEALDAGFSAATCPEVERLANDAASRLHKRFSRLNRRYDEKTDHGGTQGTSSP